MLISLGEIRQSSEIAALIFASEPKLLSFLFGGDTECLSYLEKACKQPYGQFSANSHHIVKLADKSTAAFSERAIAGICATWYANMAVEFQQGTLSSFRSFLTTEQIIHLLAYKDALDDCFAPPKQHQLCLGHISVATGYRKMGVASSLIEHAASVAAELSKTELILDAEALNTNAVDCYLKAGFKVTQQSTFAATQQLFSRMTLLI